MKSKSYVVLGVVGIAAAAGVVFLASPKRAEEPTTRRPEAEQSTSAEQRALRAEKLQRKLRTVRDDQDAPTSAAPSKQVPADSSQLAMVDVADIEDSEWVQSMYDSAYMYQGPTSKEALGKIRDAKIGVHTEATVREKEDALAEAMPEMRAEIEKARKEREAEQKRFEKVGESAEAKAARDGVQLEQ